ncbi:MAG: hypothetical protein RLN62_07120 [Rickettsiales bacterium]
MSDLGKPLGLLRIKLFLYVSYHLSDNTYRYKKVGLSSQIRPKEIIKNVLDNFFKNYYHILNDSNLSQLEFFTDLGDQKIYSVAEKCLDEISFFNFFSDSIQQDYYNFITLNKLEFSKYLSFYKSRSLPIKNIKSYPYQLDDNSVSGHSMKPDIDLFDKLMRFTKYPIITKSGRRVFLTQLQANLLIGFIKGLSYHEIESILGIKKKASETYLRNLKAKTNFNNRQEILRAFIKQNPWVINE